MKYTKRPSTLNDYQYAKQVHDLAYRDWTIAQFGPWDQQAQDKFFDDSWHRHNYEIFLIDDKPCGYCAVEYTDNEIRVREFAIHPDYQGKGIGSDFLKDLVTEFHTKSTPIRLNAFKANTSAIKLYKRLGFIQTGECEVQQYFEWLTT